MTPAFGQTPINIPRKIARRLIPFLLAVYVTAYIDRVNVGFAGLEMTRELHFSNAVFGFGAGIFFFGYCLLEIPGAMLVQRWSARKWIAGIMIVWGILASFTGLIQSSAQFNIIRFLLGLAEGGFFPAVIVYLTHWFRREERAKAVAMFMSAIPVANAIGGPIAGRLLSLQWMGFSGWRWLLMLEGLPALVGGLATLFYLTDWPHQARWLSAEERAWITEELAREDREKLERHPHTSILAAFRNPLVLALTLSYFGNNMLGYGLFIWMPKMVAKFPGLTIWQVALVASIPHLCAIPAMWVAGWHSDKTGERRWHAIAAVLTAAAGLAISQIPGLRPAGVVAGFSLAAMGIMSYLPCFWAVPAERLSSAVAAAAIGFINLVGNLGGFAGPFAIGALTDLTGTYRAGVMLLVASAVMSATLLACLRDR